MNQQQDLTQAVQMMRQGAMKTRTLKSTRQKTVIIEGKTIMIEPTLKSDSGDRQ
jgi:hypothetical protein